MTVSVSSYEQTASEVLADEPMSAHTSWRVGGPAELFCRPRNVAAVAAFLHELPPDMPVYWMGLGSNLLVRDGGLRGAVVCTGDLERSIERVDAQRVRVSAGVPCTTFARHCVRLKLGPAAFFAGIPGTIGGALAMNAGAFGGETWNNVEHVETIDRQGVPHERTREEYSIVYRSVSGPAPECFTAATFQLEPDEHADMNDIAVMVKQRGESQPIGKPSCGSVFRNPPGEFAGRLIEAAGMKGAQVGGASVSDKHANFIINEGDASAADIEARIERVRAEVRASSGVELELEVRIVGEPAGSGGQG